MPPRRSFCLGATKKMSKVKEFIRIFCNTSAHNTAWQMRIKKKARNHMPVALLQACRQQPGDAPPIAGDDRRARPVPPRLDPLAAADPDAIDRAGARREDPSVEKSGAAAPQKPR